MITLVIFSSDRGGLVMGWRFWGERSGGSKGERRLGGRMDVPSQIGRNAVFHGFLAAGIRGSVCWISDDSVCKDIRLFFDKDLYWSIASMYLLIMVSRCWFPANKHELGCPRLR